MIHNSKKEYDNKRLRNLGALIEEWDLEAMKDKYDQKIKQLVDYIRKIRENNDFFNFDVDNNILVSTWKLISFNPSFKIYIIIFKF